MSTEILTPGNTTNYSPAALVAFFCPTLQSVAQNTGPDTAKHINTNNQIKQNELKKRVTVVVMTEKYNNQIDDDLNIQSLDNSMTNTHKHKPLNI